MTEDEVPIELIEKQLRAFLAAYEKIEKERRSEFLKKESSESRNPDPSQPLQAPSIPTPPL